MMVRKLILLALLAMPALAEAQAPSNKLIWQDNSNNETHFNIERKSQACAGTAGFVEIATVGPNQTTFTDMLVVAGGTYCYRVRATNVSLSSAPSNVVERTIPLPLVAPVPPSALGVTAGP